MHVLRAVHGGQRTVNELAATLGVTDNAVRAHLARLERDGLVRTAGAVHSGAAGKPAAEYEVTPAAEVALSRAYAPALGALVETLSHRLASRALRGALADAGRRLAVPTGRRKAATLAARAEIARDVLAELGASVRVDVSRTHAELRGNGCPLAAAVTRVPATCTMVETMLAEQTGGKVSQRCEHGVRPRCVFRLR
jgi:predicted ArsR family transcriptional regulator